jgi:DNA invertase Pin-like site-specific DNA recombinase
MVKKTIIPATKKLGKELIKEASPEHKLRVCAYVRVSTDSEEQLESFNAQIGRYKRIIQEEHADTWEFVGIFADTESGTSIDKREEFQDMMDKCREGLIDLILVKQMSRFGRNTINTLQAIYELRNLGVEVYFETEELYASNSKLDFMLTMYSALAQEESHQQSVRVSSGIHERMESGNISKRVRPILGYRKDSFDKIYIYEPEAIAIRTVFMLFVSNIKMHDVDRFIRRDFASLNFSKTFRTRMYESIISNPRYKGDVVLQKTFKSNYVSGMIKRNKGERPIYIYEGYHSYIVPPQFFEYVQGFKSSVNRKTYNANFSSIFYCGLCTRNLMCHQRKDYRRKDRFYTCHIGKHSHDIYCSSPYYDRDLLDNIFINILKNQTDIKDVALRIKETLKVILLMSFGAKKKFDLIKVNTDLLEQQAELKKNEALEIQNSDVINDELFINNLYFIKERISLLEKQRRDIKRKDYAGTKEQRIDSWIDKLLDENFNYSLLADIHHYKMIVLPNYELIIVKCKEEIAKDEFRKLIPAIIQKEKRFVDSLEIKKNGTIINYSYAIFTIRG